ncbi:MAG: hypothetical protein OSP8Acid_03630 [uncultured Acidilobus sp. OSP8]|nr:MAG: hypothetical protein OSP8Acid_03630 [uncultured Acidilobus sp. OSP8]
MGNLLAEQAFEDFRL